MLVCRFGGPQIIVKLFPVAKWDTTFLMEQTKFILEMLKKSSANPIAIVCDSNRVNQSLFKQFETIKPWSTCEDLFLSFDYVHILKLFDIHREWLLDLVLRISLFLFSLCHRFVLLCRDTLKGIKLLLVAQVVVIRIHVLMSYDDVFRDVNQETKKVINFFENKFHSFKNEVEQLLLASKEEVIAKLEQKIAFLERSVAASDWWEVWRCWGLWAPWHCYHFGKWTTHSNGSGKSRWGCLWNPEEQDWSDCTTNRYICCPQAG